MSSIANNRRAERLAAYCDPDTVVDSRTFNVVMGTTVAAGLLVNAVLCLLVGNVFDYINPILFMIMYFVSAIVGTLMSSRSDNPVISLAGYALVVVPVGLVISTMVYAYGGVSSDVVRDAFLFTFIITIGMMGGGALFPQFFSRLGGVLFFGLIGIILCEIVCMIFSIQQNATSWLAAVIFSLYIGYDFYRSQQYPTTIDNAIDCALDLYLDIANLFIRLLEIFGSRRD